jgi:S1-C subfamily serine protease
MYILNASKPGETVTAVIVRNEREISLQVTLQEANRR